MIKKLRYLCTLLLLMVVSIGWSEEVYKTALFGASYNSESISSYSATWTATNEGFIVTLTNFNNNKNGWSYVKCGSKKNASVATITTTSSIDKAITKVVVTIDDITANSVNSIKLYTSSDNSTWSEAGSFSKAIGAQEVALASPTANLYYKVEFDCAQGSTNGLVTVSKVEYYYNPSDKCALPTFSPAEGTYASAKNVTISSATEGAAIYYTMGEDPVDPTTSSNLYTSAINVSSTTTIKAIAVKSGLTNSSIATATYTIVSIENEGTEENPYTVSDARNAIDANTGLTDVYAKGFVKEIPYAYTTNNGITFNMVDEEDDEVFLQAYKCTGTDANNVKVGDIVVVKGNLTKYNSTYEFAQGCELVSLEHPQSPTITLTPEAINLGSSNPIGSEISKTFTVSQINLTADIALSISGQGAVSPATIGKGAGDTEVTWIYTPTEVGDISATITATSKGAETQTLLISGSAVAPLTGDCYEQVTEDQQDWSGCYIITGTNSGNYYALTGVSNDLGSTAAVTVVGDKIESNNTTDAYQVIVAKTENGYSLYMDGVGYLYYSGSNNNLFASDTFTASSCEWTFSISDNLVTLTNVGSDNRKLQFNYNSGNSRFACYTSNQVKLTLFKYTGTVVQNPSIIAADVEIAYDATSGSISYTLENGVQGGTLTASVTSGDWLTLGTVGEAIPFTCEANTADARTATITLTYTYGDNQTITKEVRVTQTANPNVSDCAELPFEWEGGASAAFLALNGVSAKGLGTDYAAQNHAPYLIKLDTDDDYIQVNTDSQPGKVTIGVKMIGGANTSTITVQESADGETFKDVQDLTISGAQNDVLSLETTNAFAANSRYVRLLFTKGSNVGVGPITIAKTSTEPVISADNVELEAEATSGVIAYTINNPIVGTSLTADSETEWISNITVDEENKVVNFNTSANTGDKRIGVITLTYGNLIKDVTITQAKFVQVGDNKYELVTNATTLNTGDEIVFAFVGTLKISSVDTKVAQAMGTEFGNNSVLLAVDVVDNEDQTISTGDDVMFLTLGGEEDAWTFESNGKYLTSTGKKKNEDGTTPSANQNTIELTEDGTDTHAQAHIQIAEDGEATVTFNGGNGCNWLQYNVNGGKNQRFSCYSDKMSGLQIYRKVTSTETPSGNVNGDTKVDIADVTELVNIILDTEDPTAPQLAAGDFDGDNDLDADDVRALVEKILSEE